MSLPKARHVLEGDELCRVTADGDFQFGLVVKNNSDRTFDVDWKSRIQRDTFIEKFTPSDPNHAVALVDRENFEGSKVEGAEGGTEIGRVLNSKPTAAILLHNYGQIIPSVPLESLEPLSLFAGELVEYKGWIGKVSRLEWRVPVEYDDGISCTFILTQMYRTNTSFGYRLYSKLSPPVENQRITPTPEEYKTAKWHGMSLFDQVKQFMDEHFQKSARVVGSNIAKVYCKWITKVPGGQSDSSLESMPRSVETKEDILAIKQFDYEFREQLKLHSLCRYTIREEDLELMAEEDTFERVFKSKLPNGVEPPSPSKKKRVDIKVGESVVAEVIRLQNAYDVSWETGAPSTQAPDTTTKTEPGTQLVPSKGIPMTSFGFDIRKPSKRVYIKSKVLFPLIDKPGVFGVTQHWNWHDELVEVLWFSKPDSGNTEALGSTMSSRYELLPHEPFNKLQFGAIVTHSKASGKIKSGDNVPFSVGMVVRVNPTGEVDVCCSYELDPQVKVFSPSDLVVLDLPKEIFVQSTVVQAPSTEIDADKLDYITSISNDLEELFERKEIKDIKVKQSTPDSWASFSVLMIGPQNTPYEGGIFIFEVQLPIDYPNRAPKVRFQSFPESKTFLSHNLPPDGEVLLSLLKNWPGTQEEGWTRAYSLLDLFIKMRDGIFVREPYLNKPDLIFDKSKNGLAAKDVRVLADMTQLNATVQIGTIDLMLELYKTPPENWKTEINSHVKATAPLIKQKLQLWVDSPMGIFGNLDDYPKFHIFPISYGFKAALTRRIGLLNAI